MKTKRPDFVNIRLTQAAVDLVGKDGAVTVSNRHMHYTFTPGEVKEVVRRYEWNKVLQFERVAGGSEPIFEVVEDAEAETIEVVTDPEIETEGETDGSI